MAEIYGSHFEYAGKSSTEYGLIIANLNTERATAMYSPRETSTVYNRKNHSHYITKDNHSTPLSFDIEVLTCEGEPIQNTHRRDIEKWLFAQRAYMKLYFDLSSDLDFETHEYKNGVLKRNYFKCRFSNPEKIYGNGGIIGYKATLETDSDMMWQDETELHFSFTNTSSTSQNLITIDVDSDSYDYIYPVVNIITGNSGGTITILNSTDGADRISTFVGIPASSTIRINGNTNYVTRDFYSRFTSPNFPRLVNGSNSISVDGDVSSIDISFANRRNF